MKNKKPLFIILIIAGALGLVTTGAVMLTGSKFSQTLQKSGLKTDRNVIQKEAGFDQPLSTTDYSAGVSKEMGYIPPIYSGDNALEVDERAYQKMGYYQLVVNNPSEYLQQMKEYILSIEGRVLSTNFNTGKRYQVGNLLAKVPVAKFEESTQRVTQNVDKVVSEQVNAQDRTGRKVSLEDQIESLQEQKLDKEIELEEATTDLERKRLELDIKRLDNQISQLQDQLENFAETVEYSTIYVTAADSEAYFNPDTYRPTLREQFEQAWESVSGLLYIFGYILVWMIVYSLVWLPLLLLLWLLTKKFGKKKKAQADRFNSDQ